jgi:hypothetical protein
VAGDFEKRKAKLAPSDLPLPIRSSRSAMEGIPAGAGGFEKRKEVRAGWRVTEWKHFGFGIADCGFFCGGGGRFAVTLNLRRTAHGERRSFRAGLAKTFCAKHESVASTRPTFFPPDANDGPLTGLFRKAGATLLPNPWFFGSGNSPPPAGESTSQDPGGPPGPQTKAWPTESVG